MKKKIFIVCALFLAAFSVLMSCDGQPEEKKGYPDNLGHINVKKVEKILIISTSDSGEGVITDRDTIKEISEKAQALSFELDLGAAMNMSEKYIVKFMDGDKALHTLELDSDGVFWYDDTPGCYRLSEGEMEYDYIDELFKANYKEPDTNL